MVILVLGVSLGGCAPARDADPRVARIRERLRLTPPYEIVRNDIYLDGGSSMYVVRGGNRRRLTIDWDGGMRPFNPSERKDLPRMERYYPIDTIPRLLYLRGLRKKEGAVPVGSVQESTLIDLLTVTAENRLGRSFVASLDSVHDLGSLEGFGALMTPLSDDERRYAHAAGLAWGLRRQRARGYWVLANAPPADSGLRTARKPKPAPSYQR